MASFTKNDIIAVLREDKKAVEELKKENAELKEKIRLLMENNREFAELVQSLDTEVKKLMEERPSVYEYHFKKGGWRQKGAADTGKLELEKDVDVKRINSQLEEILRMLKSTKTNK